MKVLVFVTTFIYLLNTTTGLHCYECDDYMYYHHIRYSEYYGNDYQVCDGTNETIWCQRKCKFCSTFEYLSVENKHLWFQKSCDWMHVCKSVGVFKTEHPSTGTDMLVSCCQSDLCNGPEQFVNINLPSSHNKLSNQNRLFYALGLNFSVLMLVSF